MASLSPQDLINNEHIKNLIALALADGAIDELELELIQNKAEEIGISAVELDQLLLMPDHDFSFEAPSDPADIEAYLSEFVFMMMVDGIIHPEEYDICVKFAQQLDFSPADLDQIIELTKQLWNIDSLLNE